MRFTKLLPILFLIALFFISCNNDKTNVDDNQNSNSTNDTFVENNNSVSELDISANFKIETPVKVACGDMISIEFEITDSTDFDSVVLNVGDVNIGTISESKIILDYSTSELNVGQQIFKATVYAGNKQKSFTDNVVLVSDIEPKKMTYKIIKEYPHDIQAYTQGLVYDDGILFEATGLETKSSIRKVDLETGEVLFGKANPPDVFGEGLTIFNDNLIQVTWRDHIGYVYNKENFQVISEFNFNTEGWGLTSDDEFLYMSDGTHNIYVLDPTGFSVVRTIHVFDNKGMVYYLNELEYIAGYLYSNIYMQDYILKIDIETGKVLEKIDMTGILPDALRTQNTDVLNGIAFDKKGNRIFVTGKNWPKLYQVEFK